MGNLIYLAPVLGICALLFAFYLINKVSKQDAGTDRMKEIAAFIHEGASAFLMAEYKILVVFVAVLFVLIGIGIGSWVNPLGGYFIGFETLEGCAKAVVAKCKEAGVVLTGAGAPFPYGKDPKDSIIRIAPTYPSLADLTEAANVFVTCVKLVSVEKLLER